MLKVPSDPCTGEQIVNCYFCCPHHRAYQNVLRYGRTGFRQKMEGGVRGEPQERGIATAPLIFLPTKRSQSRLAFFSVRGLRNADLVLATPSFAPLLVNLESMTTKPKACGDSKYCVVLKAGMPVCNFVRNLGSHR